MAPFCPSLPANPLNTAKAWAVPARRNGWALCLWATLQGWSWEQKGRHHSHLGRKLALTDTGGQDLGLTEHKNILLSPGGLPSWGRFLLVLKLVIFFQFSIPDLCPPPAFPEVVARGDLVSRLLQETQPRTFMPWVELNDESWH